MLKLFRNQGKALRWIMGCILFLVAASMVITLVPNVFGPADVGGETLAEVDGQTVTISDVEAVLRQYRSSEYPAEALSMMAGTVIETLIAERVLLAEAEALGLIPSEEELALWLREQLPDVLFPGGKFVGSAAYEGFVRQQFRRTVAEFERGILSNIAIGERLRRMVTDSASVSETEVVERFHELNDEIQIEWAAVDGADLEARVSPTEEQLRAYFDANRLRYRHPERRPLKLITVDPAASTAAHEISDTEIELYYSQNEYRFEQPERVKVRHILFMTVDESEEESEGARRKAEEVLAQLRDGADFAELAKEHSEDPGNADNGGDLGWVSRGMMDPAFEEASFALQVGELAPEPVKSEFGYHLIRLDERQSGSIKPLSEVSEVIRADLIADRTQSDRYALMERTLDAAQQAAGALESAAAQLEMPFQEFPAFSRDALPDALPKSAALVQAIFEQPVGEVFTSGQDETVYVGYVSESVPARDAEYDEVAATVRGDYVVTEATNLARQQAEGLAEKARDGSVDFATAARQTGLAATTSEFVKRDGDLGELGPVSALGDDTFAKTGGEIQGPVAIGSRWVVFRTVELRPAAESALAAESDELRRSLLEEKRSQMFEYFREQKVQEYGESGLILRYGNRIESYLGQMRSYT